MMKVELGSWRKVAAWILRTDALRVAITQTGAHIAAVMHTTDDINPLWQVCFDFLELGRLFAHDLRGASLTGTRLTHRRCRGTALRPKPRIGSKQFHTGAMLKRVCLRESWGLLSTRSCLLQFSAVSLFADTTCALIGLARRGPGRSSPFTARLIQSLLFSSPSDANLTSGRRGSLAGG